MASFARRGGRASRGRGGGGGRGKSRPPGPGLKRRWNSKRSAPWAAPPSFGGLKLTALTYNTLATSLVHSSGTLPPSTPRWALKWEHRRERLLADVLREGPAIASLQEVDAPEYAAWWRPRLEAAGYGSAYAQRTGGKVDGVVLAWRTAVFRAPRDADVVPVQMLAEGSAVLDRDNIALVVTLQPHDAQYPAVVAGTVHLLFNQKRGDIKVAQLRRFLRTAAEARAAAGGAAGAQVLLLGDFNLTPDSALYALLSTGALPTHGLDRRNISGQTGALRWGEAYDEYYDPARHLGAGTSLGATPGFFGSGGGDAAAAAAPPLDGAPDDEPLWSARKPTKKQQATVDNVCAVHRTVTTLGLRLRSTYAEPLPTDPSDAAAETATTGEPAFTTYTDRGMCVDYLWATDDGGLRCTAVLEPPPKAAFDASSGLPTARHCSDHIPLVARLELLPRAAAAAGGGAAEAAGRKRALGT